MTSAEREEGRGAAMWHSPICRVSCEHRSGRANGVETRRTPADAVPVRGRDVAHLRFEPRFLRVWGRVADDFETVAELRAP